MKMFNTVKNERGVSVLLVVMLVGTILASFILSLQMYVAARARIVGRIRLAYKYTFVMEDVAKLALNGRLELLSGACPAGKTSRDIDNDGIVTACIPDVTTDRCVNGAACLCSANPDGSTPDTDIICAGLSASNFDFMKNNGTMVALNRVESEEEFQPAFEQSIFENLISNFDVKYIDFVERVVSKRPSHLTRVFNEAYAGSNVTYTFNMAAPNPLGANNTFPTNDGAANTSPNPPKPDPYVGPVPAFTFRNCDNDRCVDLRVCVNNTKEPALGAVTEVCFRQRITRSFLMDHNTQPCSAASGCACPASGATSGNPDVLTAGEKGTQSCLCCPWRNKF